MPNVYYRKTDKNTPVDEVKAITRTLLDKITGDEGIALEKEVPLKVHFGEKGNETYIKSANYEGIIEYLAGKGSSTCYMETNCLYGGQRFNEEVHLKTAAEHGFDQVPVVIADGSHGQDYEEVEINKKHFKTCKIGRRFLDYKQLIILSHFKGHMFAGFGGAIKQLSMGHASKGGKMAMHMGEKPHIVSRKCIQCGECKKRCNVDALVIGEKSYIDQSKCVGCGACVAACPAKAVSIFSFKGIVHAVLRGNTFREKLVEYAYAAQKGKKNIYINFAVAITKGCDCVPRKMEALMDDIGILASADPVALDRACLDMVKAGGKKFKGGEQLAYAEKIGLGSQDYKLIEV